MSVPSAVSEIIAVDNCSTDDTLLRVQRCASRDERIIILSDMREERGIGYGYAIQTGSDAAKGDVLVVVDADGTYPLNLIDAMVTQLNSIDADALFTERRSLRSPGWSPVSRAGTKVLDGLLRLFFGHKIKDSTSGMWVIRRGALEKLSLKEGGWDFSLEIKLEALQKKLRVIEYPVSLARRMGESKQAYLKTGLQHSAWLVKRRFARENRTTQK